MPALLNAVADKVRRPLTLTVPLALVVKVLLVIVVSLLIAKVPLFVIVPPAEKLAPANVSVFPALLVIAPVPATVMPVPRDNEPSFTREPVTVKVVVEIAPPVATVSVEPLLMVTLGKPLIVEAKLKVVVGVTCQNTTLPAVPVRLPDNAELLPSKAKVPLLVNVPADVCVKV